MKYDFFVSYARQDIAAAERVIAVINKLGNYKTFYDKEDISLGMVYATTVSNGILNCKSFILLLSEASLNSAWCRKEFDLALNSHKTVIPIAISSLDASVIPFPLRNYQIIDYHKFLQNPQILNQIVSPTKKKEETEKDKSSNSSVFTSKKTNLSNKHHIKKTWVSLVFVLLSLFCAISILIWTSHRSCLTPTESSIYPKDSSISLTGDSLCTCPQESNISHNDLDKYEHGQQENNNKLHEKIENLKADNTTLFICSLVSILSIVVISLLFISYRHKTRNLYTDLNITSDAKTEVRIGKDNFLIEKESGISVQLPVGIQKLDLNYLTYNNPKCIYCFIGGSTDLQAERDALRATISVVHNEWREKNFQIFSFTFEDFDKKFVPGGQQLLYDKFIENNANLAIFIIKGDVGDKTVKEFNKAYNSFKSKGRPSIVVYNEKLSVLGHTAEMLKKQVEGTGQYWNNYDTMKEMKYHFQDILSTDLWNLYEKELIS